MSLSQRLREKLQVSRALVDAWSERECRKADDNVQRAQALLHDKQRQLDEASTRLLALQMERGCHINNENDNNGEKSTVAAQPRPLRELQDDIQNQTTANARMDDQLAELKRQLQDVQAEHEHEKARAMAAQQQAASVKASKMATIQDLTQGLVNYKYLGLHHEKEENDQLRLVFTQLNPMAPDQKYSFCITMTDDEEFSIVDCEPANVLSEETLRETVEPLNRNNDMRSVVRDMRKAFLEHL